MNSVGLVVLFTPRRLHRNLKVIVSFKFQHLVVQSQNKTEKKKNSLHTHGLHCWQTDTEADRQALECDQVSVSGVVHVQLECMIKGSFIETEAH